MWEFVDERKAQIAFSAYQHVSLVVQAVLLATIVAVVIAVIVTRVPRLEPVANALSAIGLTIPSFALLGILIPLVGIGVTPAFIAVAFYAALPVLRNAVVGLQGVDRALVESARGLGMGEVGTLTRVRLPLAWPVILAGVRVSTQMSMGVAAIAAYVLGPGLGSFIFTGLSQIGGANALNSALVGTVGVVVLALALDALLLAIGKVTVSKGIRAR
ncbi:MULTISPECIES: ABC transporter permease [Rhodococcus]|jgi:osmoprotectant transport system permease protein|nr:MULTISPECIES: ABC transporter permease [Rhodococcus]ETT24783.1 ABC-type transporter, integral membrane subunit [Rhodococcus rhodochrous ATCC 21198]NCL73516.1 Choline transport system permease protein OpuBB [Rhodococcus sp. YH1]AKE92657.1 ABC transporter permease [Rhodococcus aetherivorans]ANZ28026.1 ABC transporter permease [Rhodococcus sp. WB1]KDE12716.1 ABC transporter permease [Rhodococcus aetherivorans]